MIALTSLRLLDYARSQRWVAPLAVYAVLLALVYSVGAGPAPGAFSVTATALMPVAAWLAWSLISGEQPAAEHVYVVSVRGPARAHASMLLAAFAVAAPLVLLAVAWAGVANHEAMDHWEAWAGGFGLHLLYVVLGVGIGAFLARPLTTPPGAAVVAILALLLLALIVPASPLAAALRVLNREDHLQAVDGLAGPLAILGCFGGLCLALSFTRRGR
jgi:hypothetical protein